MYHTHAYTRTAYPDRMSVMSPLVSRTTWGKCMSVCVDSGGMDWIPGACMLLCFFRVMMFLPHLRRLRFLRRPFRPYALTWLPWVHRSTFDLVYVLAWLIAWVHRSRFVRHLEVVSLKCEISRKHNNMRYSMFCEIDEVFANFDVLILVCHLQVASFPPSIFHVLWNWRSFREFRRFYISLPFTSSIFPTFNLPCFVKLTKFSRISTFLY
jgi:hypothetical protein